LAPSAHFFTFHQTHEEPLFLLAPVEVESVVIEWFKPLREVAQKVAQQVFEHWN
jgi:hypothetical protein